jgi:hypothetical protein
MKIRWGTTAIVGLLFWFQSTAQAQTTYEGCRDAAGRPVASVANNSLQDVAMAALGPNGQPIIYYNQLVLSNLSPQSRLFWYGHECGHHALGHTLGRSYPSSREQEADCFGITTLVGAGRLDLNDVRIIQSEISHSPGDWTHLPGPQRAINLGGCLLKAGLLQDSRRSDSRREQSPLYCCDAFGYRRCPIVVNPGPPGSACACSGLSGYGVMCR